VKEMVRLNIECNYCSASGMIHCFLVLDSFVFVCHNKCEYWHSGYEHVYSHKAAQKKNSTKNSNMQPSLHIHQTSGTPNQQSMNKSTGYGIDLIGLWV